MALDGDSGKPALKWQRMAMNGERLLCPVYLRHTWILNKQYSWRFTWQQGLSPQLQVSPFKSEALLPVNTYIVSVLLFSLLPPLSLPRWKWLALSHSTPSHPMAVFGNRADVMFLCIIQNLLWIGKVMDRFSTHLKSSIHVETKESVETEKMTLCLSWFC